MKTKQHDAIVLSSSDEKDAFGRFTDMFENCPIPPDEMMANLGLFLYSKNLSRLLAFYELYKMIVSDTHGIIAEFGVRWGQNLALFSALRGIFEPFNRHRKIVGFDTFAGFTGVTEQDGQKSKCSEGSFSVTEDYDQYLSQLLNLHEAVNPISHIRRYELIKGDACKTVPEYLQHHPETVIAMAVFDFDIYAPTKAALEAIKPCLCKGSVLVFDELCDDIFPGETVAVKETLGLNNLRIKRFPMTSRISYAVIE